MPLLVTEAAKLAIEDRQRGVIEEIIDKDELFALFPFTATNDEVYSYVREKTVAGGGWFSAYDDLEESASTFEPVSTHLRVLAGQVDIDNFTAKVRSGLNDQIAIQIAAKAKGLGRDFRRALVNGDSATNPKQFDGLRKLVVAGQTIPAGTDGNPLSYSMLDEVKDAVKLGTDVLMMRSGTWRALRELNRLQGGNTAETVMIENFGVPVRAYDGTPVIINDYLPKDEEMGSNPATTSIYALRLNEADGFHGLYHGTGAGIELEDPIRLEKRDAKRYRLKWYCGCALKATHAVARIKGVTNI